MIVPPLSSFSSRFRTLGTDFYQLIRKRQVYESKLLQTNNSILQTHQKAVVLFTEKMGEAPNRETQNALL